MVNESRFQALITALIGRLMALASRSAMLPIRSPIPDRKSAKPFQTPLITLTAARAPSSILSQWRTMIADGERRSGR